MPVRLIGIDSTDAAAARPAITAAERALPAAWLSNPQPLTALVQQKHPVTMNAQRLTDKIQTGQPTSGVGTEPLVLEPAWCSLMDRHVLFVTVANARTNQLLAAAHTAIPRAQWAQTAQGNALAARFTSLARTALGKVRPAAEPADALHVGIDLKRNVTRADEGSSLCLSMLLEEQLAKDYTVARALGTDMLATARDQLGLPAELRRPTRRFVINWQNLPETGTTAKRNLPAQLDLEVARAESVLGQHIPEPPYKSRWTFSPGGDGQIGFVVDSGFRKLLDGERDTLKLADLPEIAKVDRAWVYLDRGRAWGMKMNDRMIGQGPGGEPIKGHVVRFFGPELKILSPRGYPIREGAILYIRKNQRLAKLGQTFQFDPKTFPAPWPPAPAANGGKP
jgi:hypothetical protein